MSDYLASNAPVEETLVHPKIGRFVVLPGGWALPNSLEMLASGRMADRLSGLSDHSEPRVISGLYQPGYETRHLLDMTTTVSTIGAALHAGEVGSRPGRALHVR